MNESLTDFLSILRGAWRFRWYGVALAWTVAVAGWVGIFMIPNSFESREQIYLETDSVLRPLLTGLAVGTDEAALATFVANSIRSRPVLERVARDTGLRERAPTAAAYEAMMASLPKRVMVVPGPPRNVFSISFQDRDPVMAQKVVKATVSAFVEDALGLKRADSSNAMQFLTEQTKEYEGRLREAEERLAQFKRQNVGLMPGDGGDYYTRLQTEMTNLEKLKNSYSLAMQKKAELSRQLEGEEPTFGLVAPTRNSSPIDARIAELKAKLENLLLTYTDKHPEVISIKETILQLEQQKKDRATATAGSAPGALGAGGVSQAAALRALDINPVYQSTKLALGQVDVDLVELRGQIGASESRVHDLRSKVTTIPEIEAQLARLNRDYDVDKAQYTQLLQRLESARLSGEAAETSRDTKFKIVEPAVVPMHPISPNRLLLAPAILLLALGAGVAAAIGLNFIKPVVTGRAALRALTGLESLGSVSLIEARVLRWRDRPIAVFGGGVGLLVVVFVFVIGAALVGPLAT